jgi:hypothetical protein
MSKGKFVLNRAGVRQMLRSPEAMAVVTAYAHQISNRAGAGYGVDTYTGKTRVNASVYPATEEARQDNYDNNTLLKARGGGK